MTKKRKTITIVSVGLILIMASGFGFVMATGAHDFGPEKGFSRFHKRGMPIFMQREISSFIIWRMDKGFGDLSLSEVQQKLYEQFRNQLEKTMETGIESKVEFKKQALDEFEKEMPDLSIMAAKIQSEADFINEQLSKNLTLFSSFYDSLDNSQKKEIIGHIKERMANHHNFSRRS